MPATKVAEVFGTDWQRNWQIGKKIEKIDQCTRRSVKKDTCMYSQIGVQYICPFPTHYAHERVAQQLQGGFPLPIVGGRQRIRAEGLEQASVLMR